MMSRGELIRWTIAILLCCLLAIWYNQPPVSPRIQCGRGHSISTRSTEDTLSDCSRQQLHPYTTTFELLIAVPFNDKKHFTEFTNLFLRSLLFFWPTNQTNLVIVSDYESANRSQHERLCSKATAALNSTHILFNKPSNVYTHFKTARFNAGWYRQQWVLFWADNFTTADYVGFIDTDAVMATVPIAGDLFVGRKPVLFGCHYEDPRIDTGVYPWIRPMEWALRGPVQFFCGTFPIIFHRRHIRELRDYMVRKHNVSTFDDFYTQLAHNEFSLFIIMCNYVFRWYRNDYVWNIQHFDRHDNRMPYSRARRVLGLPMQAMMPRVRVTQHFYYKRYPGTVEDVMRQGYCFFEDGRETSKACSKLREKTGGIHQLLYSYEQHAWLPFGIETAAAYVERRRFVERCDYRHNWNRIELARLNVLA